MDTSLVNQLIKDGIEADTAWESEPVLIEEHPNVDDCRSGERCRFSPKLFISRPKSVTSLTACLSKMNNEEMKKAIHDFEKEREQLRKDNENLQRNEEVLLKELQKIRSEFNKTILQPLYDKSNDKSEEKQRNEKVNTYTTELHRLRGQLHKSWTDIKELREESRSNLKKISNKLVKERETAQSIAKDNYEYKSLLKAACKKLEASRSRVNNLESKLGREKEETGKKLMEMRQGNSEWVLRTQKEHQSSLDKLFKQLQILQLKNKGHAQSRASLEDEVESLRLSTKEQITLNEQLQNKQDLLLRAFHEAAKALDPNILNEEFLSKTQEPNAWEKLPTFLSQKATELKAELIKEQRRRTAFARNYSISQRRLDRTLQRNQVLSKRLIEATSSTQTREAGSLVELGSFLSNPLAPSAATCTTIATATTNISGSTIKSKKKLTPLPGYLQESPHNSGKYDPQKEDHISITRTTSSRQLNQIHNKDVTGTKSLALAEHLWRNAMTKKPTSIIRKKYKSAS